MVLDIFGKKIKLGNGEIKRIALNETVANKLVNHTLDGENHQETIYRILTQLDVMIDLVKAFNITFENAIATRRMSNLQDVFYDNSNEKIRNLNKIIVKELREEKNVI